MTQLLHLFMTLLVRVMTRQMTYACGRMDETL